MNRLKRQVDRVSTEFTYLRDKADHMFFDDGLQISKKLKSISASLAARAVFFHELQFLHEQQLAHTPIADVMNLLTTEVASSVPPPSTNREDESWTENEAQTGGSN